MTSTDFTATLNGDSIHIELKCDLPSDIEHLQRLAHLIVREIDKLGAFSS